MRTTRGVRDYFRSVDYPAGPEGSMAAAQDNAASSGFVGLLRLLPAAVACHASDEAAKQLRRIQGLG